MNVAAACVFLLDWIARSAVVAIAALALRAAAPTRSAALRHAILRCALILVVALPFVPVPPTVVELAIDPGPFAEDGPRNPTPDRGLASSLALVVWAVGATLSVIRLAMSARPPRADRSQAVAPAVIGAFKLACFDAGIRRHVTLSISNETRTPSTHGWLRPCVVVPRSATHWPGPTLAAALRHEAAHVRRADWLVFVLARLVACLHWPNPIMGRLARDLERDAEDACDDDALSQGAVPSELASALLATGTRQNVSMAGLGSSLVARRIERVLADVPRAGDVSRFVMLPIVLALASVAVSVRISAPVERSALAEATSATPAAALSIAPAAPPAAPSPPAPRAAEAPAPLPSRDTSIVGPEQQPAPHSQDVSAPPARRPEVRPALPSGPRSWSGMLFPGVSLRVISVQVRIPVGSPRRER